MEIPSTHRAAVVIRDADGFHFTVRCLPVPSIKPWEILVKLSVTGVCGSDILLASGKAGPTQAILGHEGVGRIVALGSGIDTSGSGPEALRLGLRVGIAWVRDVCGACACCKEPGGETRCLEQFNSGRKWDGTFAEYAVVPARYVLVLPDEGHEDVGVADELIAPVLCGGVTAYKALKVCGATPGRWIAIYGAGGGVGALGVQYARAMGYRLIAVDIGETKREFCLSLGADLFVDALVDDVEAVVKAATRGGGAKAVIVAAGSEKAYESAGRIVAALGTIMAVGIPPPGQNISVHPLEFIDRGIKIEGVAVGTRLDTLEALEFVRRGAVKPAIIPARLEDLDNLAGLVASSTGKYVIHF